MTDHVSGDWYLVIDLGQAVSGAELDPSRGVLRVPFASQQSVHVAAGRLRLYISPPAQLLQGEVVPEREAVTDG